MGQPTPTTNPITDSNQWSYFTLAGYNSPGTITIGGFQGFERKTGWDEKAGKGTQGATLTLKTQPPAKGSFTLQLFQKLNTGNTSYPGADDFGSLDTFVASVLALDASKQKAQGLSISYPGLAAVGVYKVVVAGHGPLIYKGKGMYHYKIDLIEWTQPPPASVVSTVSKTKANVPDSPSQKINPTIQDLQLQIANERLKGGSTP